jgi:exosortase E/protease (VPEID-CTERM system)
MSLATPVKQVGLRKYFITGPTGALFRRAASLALLFAFELVPVSNFVQDRRGGAGRPFQQWLVAVSAILVVLLVFRAGKQLERISLQLSAASFGWFYLCGHVAALAALVGLSALPVATQPVMLIFAGRCLAGVLTVVLGIFSFTPPGLCLNLIRETVALWVCALAAGTLACLSVNVSWSFWQPAVGLTFVCVKTFLGLFFSKIVYDPHSATIGTQAFTVQIGAPCSGVEGVGLMAVFSVAWLWFFRRECRFPAALLLIPASLVTIWIANSMRITALVMIGNAGAPDIAEKGFHSQAGWIAFNAIAVGLCLVAERVPWLTTKARRGAIQAAREQDATAAYLVPFLSILAAGMLARSASGAFEWFYPLRFFAAAAALWYFRGQYGRLDWRFGWQGVGIGVAIFGMWLGLDRLTGSPPNSSIGSGLASWPASMRIVWLTFRTTAAVVTVPVAEELAFRAFLIRRLIARDFESMNPRSFTWVALLLSSVVFGFLHGGRWLAGIVAGLAYAFALLRRGRIGDAVIAHATTNALLAVFVLLQGRWDMW